MVNTIFAKLSVVVAKLLVERVSYIHILTLVMFVKPDSRYHGKLRDAISDILIFMPLLDPYLPTATGVILFAGTIALLPLIVTLEFNM